MFFKQDQIPEDTAIVDLYWARDENAIYYTDKKYKKYLLTIAYNIVHDNLDCEECLNDTYLGAWNSIPPHRPNVLLTFISKIMRRVAVSCYRKKNSNKRIPTEFTVSLEELNDCLGSDSSETQYDSEQIAKAISTYLRGLSQRSQSIFVCRYYCSDSIEAISKMFEISESSVYKELASIRKGLKQHLEMENIII